MIILLIPKTMSAWFTNIVLWSSLALAVEQSWYLMSVYRQYPPDPEFDGSMHSSAYTSGCFCLNISKRLLSICWQFVALVVQGETLMFVQILSVSMQGEKILRWQSVVRYYGINFIVYVPCFTQIVKVLLGGSMSCRQEVDSVNKRASIISTWNVIIL